MDDKHNFFEEQIADNLQFPRDKNDLVDYIRPPIIAP